LGIQTFPISNGHQVLSVEEEFQVFEFKDIEYAVRHPIAQRNIVQSDKTGIVGLPKNIYTPRVGIIPVGRVGIVRILGSPEIIIEGPLVSIEKGPGEIIVLADPLYRGQMRAQCKVLIGKGVAETQGVIGNPGAYNGPILLVDDPILVYVHYDHIPYLGIGLGRIEYLGLILKNAPKFIIVVDIDGFPNEPTVAQ